VSEEAGRSGTPPESGSGGPPLPDHGAIPGRPTGGPDYPPAPARRRRGWPGIVLAALVALLAGALLFGVSRRLLRPSEAEIRGAVYTAIQRETPQTFLVTGSVDVTATTTVSNTRWLLPGILGLNLGTTTATVRMPGRVSYGVDLSRIGPEDIVVEDGGIVRVLVPSPEVWSVEPVLTGMEVQTDVGWARLYSSSGRAVEQEAIRLMEAALRAQGEAHLADAGQPRLNSNAALEAVLIPALVAAGVDDPRISVLFTDGPQRPRRD